MREKFDNCAGRLLTEDKASALGDAVEVLETLDDIREITSTIGDAGLSMEFHELAPPHQPFQLLKEVLAISHKMVVAGSSQHRLVK